MGTETELRRKSFVKHELNKARVVTHLENAADEGEEGCFKDSSLNDRVRSLRADRPQNERQSNIR